MIVNLKEARILDKAVQTLSLEESYATKLLDLNNKMVRFRYGRLKSGVGKIKSNLRPEDIAALRTLEVEGRFKPETPTVSSSSCSKIAAAARRLKLNSYRRTSSAAPRLEKPRQTAAEPRDDQKPMEPATTQQRMQRRLSRRGSIMSDQLEMAAVLCKKTRPHTTKPVVDTSVLDYRSRTAPAAPDRPNTALILEKIATAQKARKNLNKQTSYSCHDERGELGAKATTTDDVFGPNPYDVRRRKLLEGENQTCIYLNKRQQDFLGRTATFVEENPSIVDMQLPEATEEIILKIDSMAARPGSARVRGRSAKSIADRIDSALLKQFAELRKTRYLRLDEKELDSSGVKTLVKDQLAGQADWRNVGNKTRVSFKSAVAL